MANKYLDNLAARGLLKVEAPTTDEVSGLVRSGAARLAGAHRQGSLIARRHVDGLSSRAPAPSARPPPATAARASWSTTTRRPCGS